MTALMEKAVERLRSLPPELQDELAPVVMMMAEAEAEPFDLSPDDAAAIARSRAQARRGEFATEADLRAIWAKHGL